MTPTSVQTQGRTDKETHNPETAAKLDRFFHQLAHSRHRPLLLLDYDGTLAASRIDRFQARPWAGVRQQLQRIQRRGHTRIAVITGRPAHEITPMLALDQPIEVWGLHGAERLFPDGRRHLQDALPATRARLDELRARLRNDALGGLFEDKANAAVIHWRGHAPSRARQIEQRARALFETFLHLEGIAILEFDAGLELRVGRDKGGAVRQIIEEESEEAPITYLGDDLTDEAAFLAVNQARGPHLSVLMRRAWRTSCAEVWLRPPAGLRTFLARWESVAAGKTLSV
ncbi:MAG: trehalose-phosphatase [Terracidiphilus sp.]